MAELDGAWSVERTGGFLPPLLWMRKEINGSEGRTILGRLGVRFDVRGRELRYRAPLQAFVDRVEPDGDGWSGRALFLGHEYGRFRLTPTQGTRPVSPKTN